MKRLDEFEGDGALVKDLGVSCVFLLLLLI